MRQIIRRKNKVKFKNMYTSCIFGRDPGEMNSFLAKNKRCCGWEAVMGGYWKDTVNKSKVGYADLSSLIRVSSDKVTWLPLYIWRFPLQM